MPRYHVTLTDTEIQELKSLATRAAWSHGYARICRTEILCYAMSNEQLARFGLLSAEPHVRWCERSAAKAASYSIMKKNNRKTHSKSIEKSIVKSYD